MKHINQLAQQLQISPDIIRNICKTLDLEISGDTVSEQVELQLVNLKAAATKENMTLEEAARHLLEMRDTRSTCDEKHRFNKRDYIKQRFGVDPETAAPDSFVGMLYQDTHRGTQLGELRHKVVLETSTLALEEFVFNGTGGSAIADEYSQAQERINSRIDNDFFAKVNWGENNSQFAIRNSQFASYETVEILADENRAISEEVVAQMLPICYQFRDESLLVLRKTSTLAVGINFLSVVTGTVVGTWVAVPPTQDKQEITSIQPILIGVGIGEIIGLSLALLLIWIRGEDERSV